LVLPFLLIFLAWLDWVKKTIYKDLQERYFYLKTISICGIHFIFFFYLGGGAENGWLNTLPCWPP
jgi:hypothetical protein